MTDLKVKLFTHTDLDGVGGPILLNRAFGSENVDFVLCNYTEINDKVKAFITSPEATNYDLILITDISVNEEVAQMLHLFYGARVNPGGIVLRDHHKTAQWLNKYEWAFVASEYEDDPDNVPEHQKGTAGTSLLYDWLIQHGYLDAEDWNAAQFTELVRCYDTWEWDRDNNQHAKDLNDLLQILGQSAFIRRFSEDISPEFTPTEQLLLDQERKFINTYIEKKRKQTFKFHLKNLKALGVYAEMYVSELGNTLAKENPEADVVVLVDPGTGRVSYRTNKDNVACDELAKLFGGGGHPKSSGSSFPRQLAGTWLQQIFVWENQNG